MRRDLSKERDLIAININYQLQNINHTDKWRYALLFIVVQTSGTTVIRKEKSIKRFIALFVKESVSF